MEQMAAAVVPIDAAEKLRFESFKMGAVIPPHLAKRHVHARSHSRNTSVSVSFSSPAILGSTSSHNSFSSHSRTPSSSSVANNDLPKSSKRNSHHRRRSSVSTRHESAEMMGLTLPDLPPSAMSDNVNFGEKDSVRRRALWALEGKTDDSFTPQVEIPELSSCPDFLSFDQVSTKPSVSGFPSTLNSLGSSKRDSFKRDSLRPAPKDQLHTLIEEDEEDEEDMSAISGTKTPPPTPVTPTYVRTSSPPVGTLITAATVTPMPTKAKQNPNLRPLSLTPEALVIFHASLPTPSDSPAPRESPDPSQHRGLRALCLTSSPSSPAASPRSSMEESPVARRNAVCSARKPAALVISDSASPPSSGPVKRRSITYKLSRNDSTGLPTPEMTPKFAERRFSYKIGNRALNSSRNGSSATEEDPECESIDGSGNAHSFRNLSQSSAESFVGSEQSFTRPLSVSEQHFLFKSHNALLARITDLERLLVQTRRISRQESISSTVFESGSEFAVDRRISTFSTSSEISEPSDEMLRLVADLKAERDELKRDVDGWRTRVADLEKQLAAVAVRVETERREAWMARSRAGILEVEKEELAKAKDDISASLTALTEEKNALVDEVAQLRRDKADLEERLDGTLLLFRQMEARNQSLLEEDTKLQSSVQTLQEELASLRSLPASVADNAETTVHLYPRSALDSSASDAESYFTDADTSFTDADTSCTELETPDVDDMRSPGPMTFSLGIQDYDEPDGLHIVEHKDLPVEESSFNEYDNGLSGYEDEGDYDLDQAAAEFDDNDSLSSEDEHYPRSVNHLLEMASSSPTSTATVSPSESRTVTSVVAVSIPSAPGHIRNENSISRHHRRRSSASLETPKASYVPPSFEQDTPTQESATPTQQSFAVKAPMSVSNEPGHRPAHSLSRTWTFPKVSTCSASIEVETDRFFDCLEDSDTPTSPSFSQRNMDSFSQALKTSPSLPFNWFSKGLETATSPTAASLVPHLGLGIDDDCETCSNEYGSLMSESAPHSLSMVPEEDEEPDDSLEDDQTLTSADEDEGMFGDVGGIKITLTPADAVDDLKVSEVVDIFPMPSVPEVETEPVSSLPHPTRKPVPQLADVEDDLSSFKFGNAFQPLSQAPISTPPAAETRPSHIPRIVAKPTTTSLTSNTSSSAVRPSLIPQPSTRVKSKPSPIVTTSTMTFMRQPPCKSVSPPTRSSRDTSQVELRDVTNASYRYPTVAAPRPPALTAGADRSARNDAIFNAAVVDTSASSPYSTPASSSPTMPSSLSSLISSPLTSRLSSFSSFSSLISKGWSSSPRSETTLVPAPAIATSDLDHRSGVVPSAHRGFVSREKQLARLRKQLDAGGLRSPSFLCQRCGGEGVVHL